MNRLERIEFLQLKLSCLMMINSYGKSIEELAEIREIIETTHKELRELLYG